jgi:cation:H+ antiporter
MDIVVHIFLFLLSAAVIWFFAGLLIESVNRVAIRFNQSGFTTAFFVLGFLTSISEISVMVNSSINKTPQISAGNLIGASFVILLFLVPLMAVVGNGIALKHTLHHKNLGLALFVAALPVFLVLDGNITLNEGVLCLLAYAILIYSINKQHNESLPKVVKAVEHDLIKDKHTTTWDVIKIIAGAAFIFIAGHLLVEEALYFSLLFNAPASLIGLVVLSIGTNIPELVIAVRSIVKNHKEIAFGDYVGSAVTNTLVFAFLPWFNKGFVVESSEFIYTAVLTVIGFAGFFIAAKTKNNISRKEGWWLLGVYFIFILVQIINFGHSKIY